MKQTIQKQLPAACPWGERIYCFDSIDSTNTKAKELAIAGAPHGTVVVAKHQTQGRGRMGRRFHSPAGLGLYLSVILRPNCPPDQLMHLTSCAAVAMCDAVQKVSGLRPGIKWVNDLILNKKKLGGILTELSVNPKTAMTDYAIIGVGINCLHKEADFPEDLRPIATSLALSGKQVSPAELAAAMVTALYKMDKRLPKEKWAIMNQYRAACITLKKKVMVVRGDQIRFGKAWDVDDDGRLTVSYTDSTIELLNSGEVTIRGENGYI